MVEGFLDELQLRTNAFFRNDYEAFIDEIIGLEHVQQKYGGQLPNVSDDFVEFPPRFNL